MNDDWPVSAALGLRRLLERAGVSTYRVLVRDLVLLGSIGIYDYERAHPQRVRISVELDVSTRIVRPRRFRPGSQLRVRCRRHQAHPRRGHIEFVETLAERIAATCLDDPRAVRATVTVEKLDVFPETSGVGVSIVRRRTPDEHGAFP